MRIHDTETGTGKYERLLERCQDSGAGPDGRGPSVREIGARGSDRGRRELGLITPILVGPAAKIEEIATIIAAIDLGNTRNRRCPAQPRCGREGRGTRPARQGRAADERQPAH